MEKKKRATTRRYGGVDAKKRKKERFEKFIAAGIEAFGTIGYTSSTIRGICHIAGLTERYFYESFRNKEDLLCAVFRRLISQLEAEARKVLDTAGLSKVEIASLSLETFYRWFKDDPRRARIQLFEVLGVSPRIDKEYQESIRMLALWVEAMLVDFFPEIDRRRLKGGIISRMYAGGMLAVVHEWYLEGFSTPLDDLVAPGVEIFFLIGEHYRKAVPGAKP